MQPGARERKKREVRNRLSLTTLRLAREHGLRNVRVEDVVRVVGVSRRTFSNYFASKEDAIADRHVQRAVSAAQALADRPTSEPLWSAITAVVLDAYAPATSPAVTPDDSKDLVLDVLSDPLLQHAVARGSQAATRVFARAVADRTGLDADHDVLPSLVASTAVTTPLLVAGVWLRADRSTALRPALQDAFARAGAGFDRL